MGCPQAQHLPLLLQLLCLTSAASAASLKSPETCQSLECVTLAAGMASMMNQSAEPCEDFYGFACGNFPNLVQYDPRMIESHERVDKRLYEGTLTQMVQRVEKKIFELLVLDRLAVDSDPDIQDLYNVTQLFFRGCTEWIGKTEAQYPGREGNELPVSFLKGMLEHLMQSIEPAVGREKKQLEEIVAALVRAGGSGLIYVTLPWGFTNEAFQKNSDLTNITRAFVSIPRRSWLSYSYEKSDILYEKYLNYLKTNDILRSLSLEKDGISFRNISDSLRTRDVWSEDLNRKCPVRPYDAKYTVTELDDLSKCAYPENAFSWTLFIEELLQSPIDADALVQTNDLPRMLSILSYFKSQPVYSEHGDRFSVAASYLIFDWLMSFGNFLPRDLQQSWRKELKDQYKADSIPVRSNNGRIEECMLWTKTYMQPVVERMYRSVYHPQAFGDVKDLINLVKNASIDSVRRQSWITASGQEAIVTKIEWVQHSIGLDELSAQQMKEFYNTTLAAFRAIEFSPSGPEYSFGSLMSVVLCANARRNFYLIGGKIQASVFMAASSLVVNAFNSIENNRIIFPMAILEPPVYHPNYPLYIKLGSLGLIIGHEIGHSFDDEGHELNRLGAVGHFWDNQTETAYLERVECVRSCYGNYTLYPGGPKYNSGSTLGNDISDIIGIRAAYGVLQMHRRSRGDSGSMPNLPNLQANLSQDQLFFVQAAQNWCMKVERNSLMRMFGNPRPSHSANHLRVVGMMQNSWEFARAFQCRRGQEMHPMREKCTFW